MELIRKRLVRSPSLWQVNVGDVVDLVYEEYSGQWKIRKFTGICISVARGGTFRYILRNVFNGIPVELSFDGSCPSIISFTKTAIYKSTSTRRSRLYYLRRRRLLDSKV